MVAPSSLLGYFFRTGVIQLGDSRGYRALRPLMTGIIAGVLLSGVAWMTVDVACHAITGRLPSQFAVFQS